MTRKVEKLPSHEYLTKRLKYDPDSGGLFWNPVEERTPHDKSWNTRYSGNPVGFLKNNGYLVVNITDENGKKTKFYAHRLIWKIMMGEDPPQFVDHFDGNKQNNKWDNLRDCTPSENNMNMKMFSNNTSGVTGVVWNKSYGKWWARVTHNKNRISLGYFNNIDDAEAAVLEARSEYGYTDRHGTQK